VYNIFFWGYNIWEWVYVKKHGRKPGDFDRILPGMASFLLGCVLLFGLMLLAAELLALL
jgi:hypothetical protein